MEAVGLSIKISIPKVMCYCIFIASDFKFPLIPLDMENRGFNANPVAPDHPIRKWFSMPQVVTLGSHTWCACGLNYQPSEISLFDLSADYRKEDWEQELMERELAEQCLKDYFGYLQMMLQKGSLEWYCCWDGDWELAPKYSDLKTIKDLPKEPDFSKSYPLVEQQFILFQADHS